MVILCISKIVFHHVPNHMFQIKDNVLNVKFLQTVHNVHSLM